VNGVGVVNIYGNLEEERIDKEIEFKEGYKVISSGQIEDMKEMFSIIGIAMVTAILLIFLILAARFESYLSPIFVMFTLPLAIIGAVVSLYVMGSELSLSAALSIVVIIGVILRIILLGF